MANYNGIRFKNLGDFKQTIREYMKHTKRDERTVLDTKAFYICRGAARLTLSADKGKIKSSLMEPSKLAPSVPVLALMVNKRRGEHGLKGLHGKAMKAQMAVILNARVRSRGFIASGWIPAIKELEKYAERTNRAPKVSRTIKQYGKAKGSAIPAARLSGGLAKTLITNAASTNRDLKEALNLYGLPAFMQAWQDEIASMKQYIQDKMAKTAKQHGMTK